jgi:hypothetical protein
MSVLPTVTAVLLHYSFMDTWTDYSFVSAGQGENCGSACSIAGPLHFTVMDTWTACRVGISGYRFNGVSAFS